MIWEAPRPGDRRFWVQEVNTLRKTWEAPNFWTDLSVPTHLLGNVLFAWAALAEHTPEDDELMFSICNEFDTRLLSALRNNRPINQPNGHS